MLPTSTSTFPQYAQKFCDQVDAALDELTSYGPGCPDSLREAIRHIVLAPGKRLRPTLVLMAAEVCGECNHVSLAAACAVEMIHTYSLIHDDLPAMDDDDLRRGRPTCHLVFGEATAILAGDALLAQAFEVLADCGAEPSVVSRCCLELAQAAGARALVGGQADDLAAASAVADLELLESIHARKTGAMFRVSLRIGALVGGASDEQYQRLDTYGEKLGLAFQITDDLLDLSGNESNLGKRTGKDDEHQKLTFPGLLGVKESERRAGQLVDEACQALGPFGERAQGLEMLARYVLERTT